MLITIILIWVQTTFTGCYLPSRTSTLHELLMKHGRYHPSSIHIYWYHMSSYRLAVCPVLLITVCMINDQLINLFWTEVTINEGPEWILVEVWLKWVLGQVFCILLLHIGHILFLKISWLKLSLLSAIKSLHFHYDQCGNVSHYHLYLFFFLQAYSCKPTLCSLFLSHKFIF